MSGARPLRFLALALGLWVGGRAAMLILPGTAKAPPPVERRVPGPPPPGQAIAATSPSARVNLAGAPSLPPPLQRNRPAPGAAPARSSAAAILLPIAPPRPGRSPPRTVPLVPPGLALASAPPRAGRWSGSAWLLLRDDRGSASLAPGGTLGGSQAGARLLYRLGQGIALSGRFYLPLRRRSGAELAAGIDWQPVSQIPLRLLAERRQDVGGGGRSAFSLIAYGGLQGRLPGGLRAEAYAQAGIVGLRARDLFADASVRVAVPMGPVELGAGAWGAAQPGVARLDAGPSLSWRLPVRGSALRLQADWRFRVAGEAAPGSGPALTLSADF